MERDTHLLWNHRGRHVPQNTPVNVCSRKGYFCPLHALPFCLSFPIAKLTRALQRIFLSSSQSQLLVLFAFLHFAMLLLSVSISTEILFTFVPPHPHTLLSTRIRKDLPSLVLNHSFLFVSHSIWLLAFSLSKLQWQIEVRLSSAGCFNFIDPPLEVTKAANCFCLWLKLCRGTHGSGI